MHNSVRPFIALQLLLAHAEFETWELAPDPSEIQLQEGSSISPEYELSTHELLQDDKKVAAAMEAAGLLMHFDEIE